MNNPLMEQLALKSPLWQAPLPFDLINAHAAGHISAAGALGMIPLGPQSTFDSLDAALDAYQENHQAPAFCFTHALPETTSVEINEDAARHIYDQLGVSYSPIPEGAAFQDLLELAIDYKPRAIGFARGVPERETLQTIHQAGINTFAICHSVSEAIVAQDFGIHTIVLQGTEAGGIHYRFNNALSEPAQPALTLLSQVRQYIHRPIVVWGDFPQAQDVVAALIAGAQGVMIDRPWLACTDAGLSDEQRAHIIRTPETNSQRSNHFSALPMRHLPTPLYHNLRSDYRERDVVLHHLFERHPDWRVLSVSASTVNEQASIADLVQAYAESIQDYIA
ncbi:nitronate monooxygenase [Suttonella sp. R2A3]|uniref:nitronate monooxygenase n=1 Tax=Suttonella sp. R2A3 TaxID=2908648 RepID=UPI001F386108|nr:nitronate monooxygenase [Suttonella sp. R2A3]UJF24802.1 nitronate monooxygenase [Suttonella sp. R2A3]